MSASADKNGAERIALVGLDVGTTTVRGLRLTAHRAINVLTGAPEFFAPQVESRLPTQFTPFVGEALDLLDLSHLCELVDAWLHGTRPADGGGVILTGLAARAPNAAAVAEALRERIGDGIVLTAADPRLEAWVAFMARAQSLSRAQRERLVINLDIGGGTTNIAWGKNGVVIGTAALYIGARHLRFESGTRRVAAITKEAQQLGTAQGLAIRAGDELSPDDATDFIAAYVEALRAVIATGDTAGLERRWPFLIQSPARGTEPLSAMDSAPLVTLSGGVGELARAFGAAAATTAPDFNDLGPELAAALAQADDLDIGSRSFAEDVGLATVWGLTLHATMLSGATVFVPRTDLLPRRDLPIVASLRADASAAAWDSALALARVAPLGAAVVINGLSPEVVAVRALGQRLRDAMSDWPPGRLLVVLIDANVGLSLGQYATDWGRRPAPLVVLDQLTLPDARLLTLGRPLIGGQIPVAFSGLCAGLPELDAPRCNSATEGSPCGP